MRPEVIIMNDKYVFGHRQRKRAKYKVAAGVADFLGVCFCIIAFTALFTLLVSMINWFRKDFFDTFADIFRSFTESPPM